MAERMRGINLAEFNSSDIQAWLSLLARVYVRVARWLGRARDKERERAIR